METEAFNIRLSSTVENSQLEWEVEEQTNGALSRYYVEVWARGGARVDGGTFHKYPLVDTAFSADPLTVDVQDATDAANRPTVAVVVFENGRGSSGQELYRHEHRFFASCGQWHYVNV